MTFKGSKLQLRVKLLDYQNVFGSYNSDYTSECIAIVNSFMPKFITMYLRNKMTVKYDKILGPVLSGD